jgi:hypothetical protein
LNRIRNIFLKNKNKKKREKKRNEEEKKKITNVKYSAQRLNLRLKKWIEIEKDR